MNISTNKKILNIDNINNKLEKLGLSQAKLAEKLSVSRETISQWLKNKKYPRPLHLLKLAEILKLQFDEIATNKEIEYEPIIAFRKKHRHKIDKEYEDNAKLKGYILEKLVPYLPFDYLYRPSTLINPENDYFYIQKIVKNIRRQIHNIKDNVLNFNHLIRFFKERHTIIIPVLWSKKSEHANALHIYLPKSMTTWIYLNLDSNIVDFKFWMAHELGHILTPDLRGEQAEDFSDAFAEALLFPEDLARSEYPNLKQLNTIGEKINYIKILSSNYIVSPFTIYSAINKYAKHNNKPKINLGSYGAIHKAVTNFKKESKKLSEILFVTKRLTSNEFVRRSSEEFETPFFNSLKIYIKENKISPGLIERLLDISYPDASSLYEELTK